MNYIKALFFVSFVLFTTTPAIAEETISFEVFSGVAYNHPSELRITDKGEEEIVMHEANYETESFETEGPYYALRIGLWEEKKGWELELIHHKIKLTNGPDEIDYFEVSHGYNLLLVNRAWEHELGFYRIGFGLVFTHSELMLRGRERDHYEGGIIPDRHISGPTMQISGGRRYYFSDKIYGVLEAKITATYANIEYEDGTIFAPNLAAHLVFGLGYDYKLKGSE